MRFLILLLSITLVISTGCFDGKGDSNQPAPLTQPVTAAKTTNVISESVIATREANGTITISWQTKQLAKGGHVLTSTLAFEGHPLYGSSVAEAGGEPRLEHIASLSGIGPDDCLRLAIAYPPNELTDNEGRGYEVK